VNATVRQARLLVAVREATGQWTTRRAMDLYRAWELAPNRRTARDDLQALANRGLLHQHDGCSEQRHYTLNRAKAGALL
jgi:hypothetical protein